MHQAGLGRAPEALAIGAAQLGAVAFPGTSRSGITIIAALMLGLGRGPATEFSFLLGIPTLMAAGGFKILSAIKDGEAAALTVRQKSGAGPLTGLPFGHVPTKVCLPMGVKVQLVVQGRDALVAW